MKFGLQNLTKKQKLGIIVVVAVLVSTGAVGAFFGVKNTTKKAK